MIREYNPKSIEEKWQKIWAEDSVYEASNNSDKEKYYILVEFPYPSADGLHVGHARPYTALDIVARKKRYEGYNVLFPMGWDAFGLPTENFAIKNKIHPKIVTENNVKNFKKQLQSIGFSFDWSREVNTTDPEYFKWTQWLFLKFYEKGLAYKKEMPINWCTSCKIGLANEEVVNGACERCGGEVVQKVKNQWMLKITEYADRLIDDLDDIDFLNSVSTQQKNWIGRSFGMNVNFTIKDKDEKLEIFTTRPDTLFGSTYMVISPEHPIIEKYRADIKNIEEIEKYRQEASKKSDFERTELVKEKTGVKIDGLQAINPANAKEMPIFVSDYVLMTYGTGAIMAVPGHDERDFEFATKFDLPIIEVVEGGDVTKEAFTNTEDGILVNSEFLNGLNVKEAFDKMADWLEEKALGERKTNYKLRDWVFSRQRYWGEPIPLVNCDTCGWVPVPENQLPVELPEVENYQPTDNGESPLAEIHDWVNTTCPKCGGHAVRETDTMPNWAGSSWYFLRYIDPKNNEEFASREALDYWMPVDWYNGGMEHTTLHLLYSRFWHKFFYDLDLVPNPEPFNKRTAHGMILGEGNVKMSKSLGNVINPNVIVDEYGADTLRTYEMFIGDFEKSAAWSENGVKGARRFLERVWKLQESVVDGNEYSKGLEISINKTIKKISHDFDNLKFNTGVAALMELLNEFNKQDKISKKDMETYLQLLNPVAPHITEEIWDNLELGGRLYNAQWPSYDESKTVENTIDMPVQINGKVRATVTIARDADKEELKAKALEEENVSKFLDGKQIVKEIFVPGKIYNIVVK